MLTQARIFEMNITICKIVQTRLPVTKEMFEALEARIALLLHLLEAVENVSLILSPDPGPYLIFSQLPARKLHHHPRHRKVRHV